MADQLGDGEPPPSRPKDEDVRKAQADVIKQLGDWSKWLITLEVAAIGAVGAVVLGDIRFVNEGARAAALLFACLGVVCFTASIVYASLLLASLPDILQQVYGIPYTAPNPPYPVACAVSAVRWVFRARPEANPVVTDVHWSACRFLRVVVHDLLHGQYGFFLFGLLCVLLAGGVVVGWRDTKSGAEKPQQNKVEPGAPGSSPKS